MIIVDRIEEGIAVLEADGAIIQVPLNELPAGVREGSVLVRVSAGYQLDSRSEQKLRTELAEKRRRIFKK